MFYVVHYVVLILLIARNFIRKSSSFAGWLASLGIWSNPRASCHWDRNFDRGHELDLGWGHEQRVSRMMENLMENLALIDVWMIFPALNLHLLLDFSGIISYLNDGILSLCGFPRGVDPRNSTGPQVKIDDAIWRTNLHKNLPLALHSNSMHLLFFGLIFP